MGAISRRICFLCGRTCCTLASMFPRVGVNMLTGWGIYVHLFSLCSEFYTSYTRLAFIVVASTLYVLTTWAYFETVRVGAGSPLEIPGFAVKLSDLESGPPIAPPNVELNVTAKENGMMRFCGKCQCWKPDRTHHCSSCRRCILRMDHHCPWFATCIGFKNQKFFLQFLIYVSLFCITCCISASCAVYTYLNELDPLSHNYLSLNWVALTVVSFVMGFAVSIFASYSFYLAYTNKTVLETLETVRYKTNIPSGSYRYREPPSSKSMGNIFDIGWYENLRQVMGDQVWEWFIPIPSTVGDGISFPIDRELYDRAQEAGSAELELLQREYNYRRSQQMAQYQEMAGPDVNDLDYYTNPRDNIPLTRL